MTKKERPSGCSSISSTIFPGRRARESRPALESAGFLDAWVMPDGRLLDAHNDTILVPALTGGMVDECLDAVLKPSIDRTDLRTAAVDENVVQAILRSIALGKGTGPIWVIWTEPGKRVPCMVHD